MKQEEIETISSFIKPEFINQKIKPQVVTFVHFYFFYFINFAVIIVWLHVITVPLLYHLRHLFFKSDYYFCVFFCRQNICHITVTMYKNDCLHGGGLDYKPTVAMTRICFK